MRRLLKMPSAWLPVTMSFVIVVMFWSIMIADGGRIVRSQDEGLPAHVFQLLMILQIPLVAFFAIRHYSKQPRETTQVLAIQCAAAVVAAAPVFILSL